MNPPDILVESEPQAAISRFFYNLAPITDGSVTELHQFSQQVYGHCARYLKPGLNLLATKAIDGHNNHQNLHQRDDDFDHQATAMVGFDATWAKQRIFGWQVNYASLPKKLNDATHGRGVIGVYLDGSSLQVIARRYDLQNREVDGASRQSTDQRMATIIANRLIRPLVGLEELAKTTAKFEQQRGDLAQKIVKFNQTRLNSDVNHRERESMHKQLADIGFMTINFRLRLNSQSDIVRK